MQRGHHREGDAVVAGRLLHVSRDGEGDAGFADAVYVGCLVHVPRDGEGDAQRDRGDDHNDRDADPSTV